VDGQCSLLIGYHHFWFNFSCTIFLPNLYVPGYPSIVEFYQYILRRNGVSVLVIFIVQIYYSHRVWIASQNAAVAVGIAVITFAAFALGIAATGIITKKLLLSSLSTPQLKAIMASSQGFTFLSGAATFAALSFYRPSQNPAVEPNVHWTGRLYSIVVGSGITRGFIATTIQLGCFVTFIAVPSQTFWMPFQLVASKVFINSLLTTLNVREVHHGRGVNEDINSRKTESTSSSSIPHLRSNIRFAVAESTRPGINVVRTNINGTTTSKVVLEDNEDSEANDHRKRTDSKV